MSAPPPPGDVYDAAAALDELLGASDSDLMASMAWFRANMATLFGAAGVTRMLLDELARSACVRHYSARSEREISLSRPSIRLRVDDEAAAAAHPRALLAAGLRPGADPGTGGNPATGAVDRRAMARIANFKSAVVFAEVCRPAAARMNDALARHWPAARAELAALGAGEDTLRMLVSNIFGVSIQEDPRVHSRDKMVVLRFLL